MEIIVNGERLSIAPQSTVSDLISLLRPEAGPLGLAIAVNGQIVPRGAWDSTVIEPEATVDIVQAVQGG